MMKKISVILLPIYLLLLPACSDEEAIDEPDFTGRETTYMMLPGSDFPISGTVKFQEKKDLALLVTVLLEGTEGTATHPVHLHYGNLSTPDAEIAYHLNSLSAETGESITNISELADETEFTYERLLNFEGSVKVHLSSTGEGKNILLAVANIGAAANGTPTGRSDVAICKSK